MNSIGIMISGLLLAAGGMLLFWRILKSRNLHIWLIPYIFEIVKRIARKPAAVKNIYFSFVDHYEPYMLNNDDQVAKNRVEEWVKRYPPVADRHYDSNGNKPRHTFFYPIEEYREDLLEDIARLCKSGYGDVEVHLHHDHDTREGTSRKLMDFKSLLFNKHGLLRKDDTSGNIIYAFIHGNWALDNSRPDGRWCGVDNELEILEQTGCYMDMTMPSAPSDTQTTKINAIYWAKGRQGKRKSHNQGRDVEVGKWKNEGELLMVQGPLTLNWKKRKMFLMPKIESSEISFDSPPSIERISLWEKAGISVKGAEEHIFIKVHTHGALEKNSGMLFEWGFDRLWTDLEDSFRDRAGYNLYYVTAWEMYKTIESLAIGASKQ